jgi:hypothetical protein
VIPTGGSSWRILPRGSFGGKAVDDCLNFGLLESVEWGFELVRGFQKTDEGFLLIR